MSVCKLVARGTRCSSLDGGVGVGSAAGSASKMTAVGKRIVVASALRFTKLRMCFASLY